MNIKEYQQAARKTAIYAEQQNSLIIYPALGLVGECGEVAEKAKKMIRDNGGEFSRDRKNAIIGELGDCCWYLANICCDTHAELSMSYEMRFGDRAHHFRDLTMFQIILEMNKIASFISDKLSTWYYKYGGYQKYAYYFTDIYDKIGQMLFYIEELAIRCDVSLRDVFDNNIKKLSSRAARGKLKGDGDDR